MTQASVRAVRAAPFLLLGVAVVLLGVAVTLLGLAGGSAFDVGIKSFAFDSTSTGLAMVAVGGGLIAGLALDGSGDRYLAGADGSVRAVDRRLASAGTGVMGLGLVLYVASILF